jgi:hypothetical protein
MRWEEHVALWETGEIHTGFLVGRPEGKRPLGKPRCTWENNIKMDIQEVVWGGVNWINLALIETHGGFM